MPPTSTDDRRAVLSKVNQVLVNAGLNDTVWSVRDCDSTLFVLMYKKLVGKVRNIISHTHVVSIESVLSCGKPAQRT